jgi:rhodanese-related sulfurtransferase
MLERDGEELMANSDEILAEARKRAQDNRLPYDGALRPAEAHQLLQDHPKAVLIDVRSRAEWDFVGRVPGAVEIEWKIYPGMRANERFVEELQSRVPKDALAMFLCRSGGRSHETAMLAKKAGYETTFNVLEGFEGDRDPEGHRNTLGGWRASNLPWTQS